MGRQLLATEAYVNPVRKAIYDVLVGDSQLTALLGDGTNGIYYRLAQSGVKYPCVIYDDAAGFGPGQGPDWTFDGEAIDVTIWTIKAAGPGTAATESVDIRIRELLGRVRLSAPGYASITCLRTGEVSYSETSNEQRFEYKGATYNVWAEKEVS